MPDDTPAERGPRPVVLGSKHWMFAGSDSGERAAGILSLIETAKMKDLDPEACLRDALTRIADHINPRPKDLLPRNWKTSEQTAESKAA